MLVVPQFPSSMLMVMLFYLEAACPTLTLLTPTFFFLRVSYGITSSRESFLNAQAGLSVPSLGFRSILCMPHHKIHHYVEMIDFCTFSKTKP